jgi:hypothetical protein
VKERCLFNSLNAFHCIGQTPFDFMHDWLEKVAPVDTLSIIMAFKSRGKFSLAAYNRALTNLKLEDYEVFDRPLPIKEGDKKLAGKALSVALHIRLMPLIVSSLVEVEEECDLVRFLVTIHCINEILMADCLSPEDAFNLQSLIIQYFTLRKACSEKYPVFSKIVPKNHYLEHYPAQILAFGPFISVWTARYESRHRDFVNWCESSKNFVNVLKTLCVKNQKKVASRYRISYLIFSLLVVKNSRYPYCSFRTIQYLIYNLLYKMGGKNYENFHAKSQCCGFGSRTPGSGSGIRNIFFPDPGSWILDPTPIFFRA